MNMSAGDIPSSDLPPLSAQRLFTDFPEYTSRYHISLSMIGKKALSLQEYLKLVDKQSNQASF